MGKENPYKMEQEVLNIDNINLESLDEKRLKELKDKVSTQYSNARKERLKTQKTWVIAYYNARQRAKDIHDNVRAGKIVPKKAIEELRTFVASNELTTEKPSTKTE